MKNKNKDWDKAPQKKEVSKNLQNFNLHGDRKTSIDLIIHNEKKKYLQYPDREEKINELRERVDKERKEKKSKIQKIMEEFKIKGSLPKCQRITIVAEAEYMGEKVPFCSLPKKKEEQSNDDNKANSKKIIYNTVFPNVRKNKN